MEDAFVDPCPICGEKIRWTSWRQYPPRWTGAPSRGDVRNGICGCAEKRYLDTRLPQELFSRRAAANR